MKGEGDSEESIQSFTKSTSPQHIFSFKSAFHNTVPIPLPVLFANFSTLRNYINQLIQLTPWRACMWNNLSVERLMSFIVN